MRDLLSRIRLYAACTIVGTFLIGAGAGAHDWFLLTAGMLVALPAAWKLGGEGQPRECTFCENHRWFTHRVRDGSVGFRVVDVELVPCPGCNSDRRYPPESND